MTYYRFVACFISECCPLPHLWGQVVFADSLYQARELALREIQQDGREVSEIIEVTHGLGEIYNLADHT